LFRVAERACNFELVVDKLGLLPESCENSADGDLFGYFAVIDGVAVAVAVVRFF
jgi:hypothetical protein